MSHWKLVEAQIESDQTGAADTPQGSGDRQWRGNSGRGNRRFGGGRNNGRSRRQRPDIFVPDTPETRQYLVQMCIQQIDAQYDVNNLCRDTYFRSFMDEEGYMPLIFLFNYAHIGGVGADYYAVLEALAEHPSLEVCMENETVRLRSGWGSWLIPNADGSKGVPKYIKQPTENESYPEEGDVEATNVAGNMRARSGSKELSASAPAFVVK